MKGVSTPRINMKYLAALISLALSVPALAAPTAASGFVKTSGTSFILDGANFPVVGYVSTTSLPVF